jgi:hypothetical protein
MKKDFLKYPIEDKTLENYSPDERERLFDAALFYVPEKERRESLFRIVVRWLEGLVFRS